MGKKEQRVILDLSLIMDLNYYASDPCEASLSEVVLEEAEMYLLVHQLARASASWIQHLYFAVVIHLHTPLLALRQLQSSTQSCRLQ